MVSISRTALRLPDVLEAQLNNVMIRSAKEVNVVTDFSKTRSEERFKDWPL